LADLDEVQAVAAKCLAELAMEILPGSSERHLSTDVRDERGRAVLTTELTFKTSVRNAA